MASVQDLAWIWNIWEDAAQLGIGKGSICLLYFMTPIPLIYGCLKFGFSQLIIRS